MMTTLPSEQEVLGYFESLSNWGRWGPEDQLGTLNLVTEQKRVEASQLIKDGTTVPLAWVLDPGDTGFPRPGFVLQRHMIWTGQGNIPHAHVQLESPQGDDFRLRAAREYVGIVPHGTSTHVDALSHIMWAGKMYNGYPASAVTAPHGATVLSVHELAAGVTTKGVVLDVTAVQDVRWLQPGEGVFPEHLEAAEKLQGVTVEAGDALFLYTGSARRSQSEGIDPTLESSLEKIKRGQSGYTAGCLPWLHERGVAIIGSDAINDVQPSGYQRPDLIVPIHAVALVAMGLWLIDNVALDDLVATCREKGRWDFFLCMPTLRIVGSTSSPVNPVAVF